MRLCVEVSVHLEGLCKIITDHPLIDVHQFAVMRNPENGEPSAVPTCLIAMRFDTNPRVAYELGEFAAGVNTGVLLNADQLRSVYSQEPRADFWEHDTEAELNRYVNRIAIGYLGDFAKVLMGRRPLLQFIGAIRVEPS